MEKILQDRVIAEINWGNVLNRAGIENFRYHDLQHT
jgi:hypothetical protein